jgi:long-chain acyl-CoA synthetase
MQSDVTGISGVPESELPLQRFYRWERERPDRLFLTQPYDGGKLREWTWSQAAREVRNIAGYLKAQNWAPGTHVALLSKNCAWWIMADLAIWMAGHVTVPVYPSLRPLTVRQILEHSGAKLCFVGPTDEKEAASLGIPPGLPCIHFPTAPGGPGQDWNAVIAVSPAVADYPTRAADELATIFYTSGTTGAPKGVMQTFTAFSFLATALGKRVNLSGNDHRILSYLPLAHILERGGQEMPAVILGWHVFFAESPDTFLADLRRARPTPIFLSVPRLLMKFQQGVFEKVPRRKLDRLLRIPLIRGWIGRKILGQLGLDQVRYGACGAAPLSSELLRWYRKLGLNLVEGYGLTEAMITHLTRPEQVMPGWVGAPLEGVRHKRAENGELLLKSPMNMLGYYKDSQATRDSFTEDEFLRTGDVVEIDAQDNVRIIGRLKEQFKTSKGKYVAPAPIEMKLAAHPAVESCCLMGAGFESPFAVVVLTAEAREACLGPAGRASLEESFRALLAELNAHLDPHERVMFIAVAEGPWTIANGLMTPTLKLRRAALEEQYLAQVDSWKAQRRAVVWPAAVETAHYASGV